MISHRPLALGQNEVGNQIISRNTGRFPSHKFARFPASHYAKLVRQYLHTRALSSHISPVKTHRFVRATVRRKISSAPRQKLTTSPHNAARLSCTILIRARDAYSHTDLVLPQCQTYLDVCFLQSPELDMKVGKRARLDAACTSSDRVHLVVHVYGTTGRRALTRPHTPTRGTDQSGRRPTTQTRLQNVTTVELSHPRDIRESRRKQSAFAFFPGRTLGVVRSSSLTTRYSSQRALVRFAPHRCPALAMFDSGRDSFRAHGRNKTRGSAREQATRSHAPPREQRMNA